MSGLIIGKQGFHHLYGTTQYGGSSGPGTGFEVALRGTESVLRVFASGSNGAFPTGSLISGEVGDMDGTTYGGGVNPCSGNGCGTVFKLRK